jgi:phage baseplate assembly protein W
LANFDPHKPPIGWPLLPVPHQGELRYPTLEESVRDFIRVILSTRKGEQLMRPRFGAGLDQHLQEPNTITTRRRIRDTVSEALASWERRIDVDRVDVFEVEAEPTHVRVEICYRIRRTGAQKQLGVTLELES